jgi:hypothetical protein
MFQNRKASAAILSLFVVLFLWVARATGADRIPADSGAVGIIERSSPKGKSGPQSTLKRPASDDTPSESPGPVIVGTDAGHDERSNERKGLYSKVLQDIVQGIYEGDYSRFARNLTEQMRATQNRQAFLSLQKKIQTNLGKLQSLDYLGFYSQGGFNMALFKARFSKDKDDVLITLVFDRGSSPHQVSGMWLDSPALDR